MPANPDNPRRSDPLTERQRALAVEFLPLAERSPACTSGNGASRMPTRSTCAAALGLCLAVRRLDVTRGDAALPEKFITFKVGRCIVDRVHRRHREFGDRRRFGDDTLPTFENFEGDGQDRAQDEANDMPTGFSVELYNVLEAARLLHATEAPVLAVLRLNPELPGLIVRVGLDGARQWLVLPGALDGIRAALAEHARQDDAQPDEQGGFTRPAGDAPKPKQRRKQEDKEPRDHFGTG